MSHTVVIITESDSRGPQEIVDVEQIHTYIQTEASVGDGKDLEQVDTSNATKNAVTPSDASETVLKLPRLTTVLEIANDKTAGIDEDSENDEEESMYGKKNAHTETKINVRTRIVSRK